MKEQPENIEKYKQLADQLDEMQKVKNNGRGIECVRWIVNDLRRGDFEMAKIDYNNQIDKFDNYSDIVRFLKNVGIAEEVTDWEKCREESD